MTFFIRPANAKSKPKAGSEPQGTIDLADCAASDGHIVAIPIAEPGQGPGRRGSPTLHARILCAAAGQCGEVGFSIVEDGADMNLAFLTPLLQ